MTMENHIALQVFANLKRARIDPHMDQDTGGITKGDGWRPFQMAKERIFPFGLSHEGDPGG